MSSMRSSTKRILAGVAALALGATAASAAPLVNVSVLGSTDGGNTYSSAVTVSPGSTVQFKVVAELAPTGTVNGSTTITSEVSGTDGINSVKFGLIGPSAGITGTINNPTLGTGWANTTGTTAGTVTGLSDAGIFAGQAAGVFKGISGATETLLTGTLSISTASASGVLTGGSVVGGSFKVNGGSTKFISTSTETGANPYVGFNGLTLNVPEPASLGLLGVSALGLMARRRKA